MLRCKCLKCGAKSELENAASGHKFACDCGEVFTIPEAPPEGDFRLCLHCSKINESDAVLCTGCGFNFITNKMYQERPAATPVTKIGGGTFKLIALLVFLAAAALAGWLVHAALTAKKYGITEETPLGKYEENRKFNLLDFKSVKMELPEKFKGMQPRMYAKQKKVDLFTLGFEYVFLLSDERGKIAALGGRFAKSRVPAGSAEGTFFIRMKRELEIPENLEFKQKGEDGGWTRPTDYELVWENEKIRCIHHQRRFRGGMIESLNTVFLVLKSNPADFRLLETVPQEYVNK